MEAPRLEVKNPYGFGYTADRVIRDDSDVRKMDGDVRKMDGETLIGPRKIRTGHSEWKFPEPGRRARILSVYKGDLAQRLGSQQLASSGAYCV